MNKIIIPLFVFIIFIGQNVLANNQGDNKAYSNFCELVTEAMIYRPDAKSRHEYIVNHFDERVGIKDIRDAYDVVFQVAPDKRYGVFKESIEERIGCVWKCGSLKEYFDQYVK